MLDPAQSGTEIIHYTHFPSRCSLVKLRLKSGNGGHLGIDITL